MSHSRIALSWPIGQFHGWGVYGLNLMFAMLRQQLSPLMLQPPARLLLHPLQMRALLPILEASTPILHALARHPQPPLHDPDCLLLRHTNGLFVPATLPFRAGNEVILTFFEQAALPAETIAYARTVPLVVTGSHWNQQVLTATYGLTNAVCILQGVDTALFQPAPAQGLLPGRFVIFSGGKLEYRKGQDLVIAAFQRFHARHPEAFLVTAWNNRWLSASSRFPERYVTDLPENNDLQSWMGRYLPEGSFLDVGEIAHPMTPAILREAHVGLFPNRCEGGTNLVAMECMAVGVPVILSDNTGHREWIDPQRCYPLTRQEVCRDLQNGAILTDWGESSVEEILVHLETIYTHHHEARCRGAAASRFVHAFSWQRQCDQLLTLLQQI
ncbi:MAG: glycosyltransferase family 4 protein [Magnetococcales bacterium]|nr:glycosyltransferase family 4 protein [Magnetococcales bacterium]